MNRNKKEIMTYVYEDDNDLGSDVEYHHVEENEIHLLELKLGPLYACKLPTPSNGKNIVGIEKSDKFPKKTYTFDMTKCDVIFNLLVEDGQILVPRGAKVPPL